MPDLDNSLSINQTGNATDANDLLSKLRVFLTANGWAENRYESITSGLQATFNKNGYYYNFRSFVNYPPFRDDGNGDTATGSELTAWASTSGVAVKLSTGYDGLLPWDEQPGSIIGSDESKFIQTNDGSGDDSIPRYDFFTVDNAADPSLNLVAVVCEYENNRFSHLYFGEVCAFGTWTGGSFMSATQKIAAVSANPGVIGPCLAVFEDDYTDLLVDTTVEKDDIRGHIETRRVITIPDIFHMSRDDLSLSKIPFNNKGTLIPPLYYHRDTVASPDEYYPLGTVPYCFTVYMKYYNPLETFYIGSRRYVVFPYHTKPVPFDDEVDESSGLGIAFKIPDNWGEE